MRANEWYYLRNASLFRASRMAGFDLAIYDEYSAEIQSEIKKRTINRLLINLEEDFSSQSGQSLSEQERCVYVIRLAGGFSIDYPQEPSSVIYIGRGKVNIRIATHLHEKLFDFMLSLQGINFDFGICSPRRRNRSDFYKDVESDMLNYFAKRFGNGSIRFPMLNKISGRNHENHTADYRNIMSPLKSYEKDRLWIIKRGNVDISDYSISDENQ